MNKFFYCIKKRWPKKQIQLVCRSIMNVLPHCLVLVNRRNYWHIKSLIINTILCQMFFKFKENFVFEEIIIKYYHPDYNIGLEDIRNAWLLQQSPVKLTTAIYRGNLIFRIPGSGKRISYRTLKKGLVKKTIILKQRVNLLPF